MKNYLLLSSTSIFHLFPFKCDTKSSSLSLLLFSFVTSTCPLTVLANLSENEKQADYQHIYKITGQTKPSLTYTGPDKKIDNKNLTNKEKTISWVEINEAVSGKTDVRQIYGGDEILIEDGWQIEFCKPDPWHSNTWSPIVVSSEGSGSPYSSILISGNGSLLISGNASSSGLEGISTDPGSEKITAASIPELKIQGIDLYINDAELGIKSHRPSKISISNGSTIVNTRVSSIFVSENKNNDFIESQHDISIKSKKIELSFTESGIFQETINSSSNIILDSSELIFKYSPSFFPEDTHIFNLSGSRSQTVVKGGLVSFVAYNDEDDLLKESGIRSYVSQGAKLTISSQRITGQDLVFETREGGSLTFGTEDTKAEVEAGFNFYEESGENKINFGKESNFTGFVKDDTEKAVLTLGENATWIIDPQICKYAEIKPPEENPVLISSVGAVKMKSGSLIDLTKPKEYGSLSLGSLEGDRGMFELKVDVKQQENDKISIKNSVKGVSLLRISSSGTGDGESDSGTLVEGPKDSDEESFILEPKLINGKYFRAIDEGLYLYRLDTRDGTLEKKEWFLTPCQPGECKPEEPPLLKPDKPSVPNLPIYSPSAEAVLAMSGMGAQNAFYQSQLSDLRTRLGEIRRNVRGEVQEGLWTLVSAQKDRISGFSSTSLSSKSYLFNFGLDTVYDEWLLGANIKYGRSKQKTKDAFFKANGKSHFSGINLYVAYHNDKGSYLDLVFGVDRFHQKLNTTMLDGTPVRGSYRDQGIGISGEVGKKYLLNKEKTWFVEPQLQLSFYHVRGRDFSLSNSMEVKQENFNSLTGRIGLVVGKDFKTKQGEDKGQIYLRGGLKHEFLGRQEIQVNDVKFSDRLNGTRFYYGLASDLLIKKNMKAYAKIEREHGKHYTKEIEVQFGMKWQF